MKKGVTTLKELAQKLNLSISTISRALNNHPDISKSTKDKVKGLALKLNYAPNIFARGFRLHKTNIIGVIVPSITHYFTSTILKGVLEEAEIKGYRVIISESNNNITKQTEMLRTMAQFGVDGILMSLSKTSQNIEQILKTLDRIPLVLFDKVSDKIPCTQIVINEEEAAFNAVEHLINNGKKRIALIKETENSYSSKKRYAGYLRALKKYNLPIDEKIVLSTEDISLKQGKMMAEILLSMENKPDAIFAITDNAAIGVIKTLKIFNIKIPEEVAVVGFSNSLSSTIIEPKLTTIDQPGKRIGSIAVKYLIEEIEATNDTISNKTIQIKTNLIIRDSSFKATIESDNNIDE